MNAGEKPISVFRLGTVAYEDACQLQDRVAAARGSGTIGDVLLLLEHPPVITIGRGGCREDVLAPASLLQRVGVRVCPSDRGGRATYHGPGQLVAYPILKLNGDDLYGYVRGLETATIRLLRGYGLRGTRIEGQPGVWLNGDKIAAVGIAVQDGVTRHGLALNVAPQMAHFDLLIPCGIRNGGVTSMERELGRAPDGEGVSDRFVRAFEEVFRRPIREGDLGALAGFSGRRTGHPAWLWQRVSMDAERAARRMEDLLKDLSLQTVCQEAHCPNLVECFGRGTATFLILGKMCTRGCRFCAVKQGRPLPPDRDEPQRVARAAARLRLSHVVITSVTRDDLPGGGAGRFAETVDAVRQSLPQCTVEVLVPDFGGSCSALDRVLAVRPDVLNHNLETVPRLYPDVRPGADYRRSLSLLAYAKSRGGRTATKSGLMLGLGERKTEVLQTLRDLRRARCDVLTLGQYLQPTGLQCPVTRYVSPDEFARYHKKGEEMGFARVSAGPLVRSSYGAEAVCKSAQ